MWDTNQVVDRRRGSSTHKPRSQKVHTGNL